MKKFTRLDGVTLTVLMSMVITLHIISSVLAAILDVNPSLLFVVLMGPILVMTIKGYPQRLCRHIDRKLTSRKV